MCLEDASLCGRVCGSASEVIKNKKYSGTRALSQGTRTRRVGSWLWMTSQASLSDHKVTLISFIWWQLGLLPEWTKRVSFLKMQQKTPTFLQQRRNGFCLRHCWVISVLEFRLSWLLPVWGRQDREASLRPPDEPEVWGRRSSLAEGAELVAAGRVLGGGVAAGNSTWASSMRVCMGRVIQQIKIHSNIHSLL